MLQSMELKSVRHDLATEQGQQHHFSGFLCTVGMMAICPSTFCVAPAHQSRLPHACYVRAHGKSAPTPPHTPPVLLSLELMTLPPCFINVLFLLKDFTPAISSFGKLFPLISLAWCQLAVAKISFLFLFFFFICYFPYSLLKHLPIRAKTSFVYFITMFGMIHGTF